MFPSYYFFISQSVPNLYFPSRTQIYVDRYQFPYYTNPYEILHKPQYEYYVPNLGKSKSSSKNIFSHKKLIKSKSKQEYQNKLDNASSSENLIKKKDLFENKSKHNHSEIRSKKRARFIETYRNKNYQREHGSQTNSDWKNQDIIVN